MQAFSSREAEERLCAVESLLDGTTARLYRKYEYLHDACLQDMVWRFDSRGKLTVALNLFQDYVSPACGLQLRAEGVLACSCDFCSKPPFPVEIYSLCFSAHPDGLEVLCETDPALRFRIAAQKVRIRRRKDGA